MTSEKYQMTAIHTTDRSQVSKKVSKTVVLAKEREPETRELTRSPSVVESDGMMTRRLQEMPSLSKLKVCYPEGFDIEAIRSLQIVPVSKLIDYNQVCNDRQLIDIEALKKKLRKKKKKRLATTGRNIEGISRLWTSQK